MKYYLKKLIIYIIVKKSSVVLITSASKVYSWCSCGSRKAVKFYLNSYKRFI